MSVSVIVKNAATTIGEGPHWDPASKSLYYVDINTGDVHKWDSRTGEGTKVHLGKETECRQVTCIGAILQLYFCIVYKIKCEFESRKFYLYI